MAMNTAAKVSTRVDERFKRKSLTQPAVNEDYDWSGVDTVKVYGINTVPLADYTRTGVNRYGNVTELGNTQQNLVLTQDRAFTFTIDKGNFTETMMVMRSGEALSREIDEVVIPEIDTYRLAALDTAAAANSKNLNTGATTSSNAYSDFLALQESLSDDLVPLTGRVAFMDAAYYSFLKQSNFVLSSEKEAGGRHSGSLGTVDGAQIVVTPSSYFPGNTNLIITHPVAMVAPRKLEEYRTHKNPPGISGWLVEGRNIFDAFVLNNKVDAIAVHRTA